MEPDEELAWADEAWHAYQRAPGDLHDALNGVLQRIAEHPEDLSIRRRRMQRPPLFVVGVPGNDRWVVMWRPGDDVPEVHYIGPDPF